MHAGGLQQIETNDGYLFLIDIINGLPFIKIRPYTNKEWDSLPKVIMTSDNHWNPKVMDNIISNKQDWYDAISDIAHRIINSPFDEFGEYRYLEPVPDNLIQHNQLEMQYKDILQVNKAIINDHIAINQYESKDLSLKVSPKIKPKKPNY